VIRAVLAYRGWWSRPKVTVGLAGPRYPAVRPVLRACCAWVYGFREPPVAFCKRTDAHLGRTALTWSLAAA
jgi:hypothetical protein